MVGELPMPWINRELSWLSFNGRVLEEALDEQNPLLERIRFLTICQTNLDEFFMIRVSGLREQVRNRIDVVTRDGLTPSAQLREIESRVHRGERRARTVLQASIFPALADIGVRIVAFDELEAAAQERLGAWFHEVVYPVLTPLGIGHSQPFPFISNLSLNLAVFVQSPEGERRFVRLKIPDHFPRLLPVDAPAAKSTRPGDYVRIEDLIGAHLASLFPGMFVEEPWLFRVTRDADVEIREDEADDLLKTLEAALRERRMGDAVRLEVTGDSPADIVESIQTGLDLHPRDTYRVDGWVDLTGLKRFLDLDLPDLKYPPFVPPPRAWGDDGPFAAIRHGDILVHHPFDSFSCVSEFVSAAARDPRVVAIKQTLYRTSGDSPVVAALLHAVAQGKQVTAVIELKARFDEENNIEWARRLEQAGVHVIYGVTGLKTHAKLCMVVRSEGRGLRRYAHIATGNYNPVTARIYTDLGLFTDDPEITADIADLFNRITGFSRPPGYRRLLVAPRFMLTGIINKIEREIEHANAGKPAEIVLKCNAITDPAIVDALYRASSAGVQIDLLVRGMCTVVPGAKGYSENIRVSSVVGRFLEHTRVYWFANDGSPEVYIGSADLMERNLRRRVEVLVPVNHLSDWLRGVYLQAYLDDRGRTRQLSHTGAWTRSDERSPDVHQQFMRASRAQERLGK